MRRAAKVQRVVRSGGSRGRLLAAAIEEFAEKGFEGATTVSIAKRARAKQPLVHHHFGSKAKLFDVVLATLFDELRGELVPDGGEGSALPALVRQLLLFTARRPQLARIWIIESAGKSARVRRIVDRHVLPLMRRVVPLVERGLRRRLDPTMVLYAIQGIITYPFLVPEQVRRATGADPRDPAFALAYAEIVEELLAPSWRRR
jgi:TetR/AcrR family transcriptional regulator